MIQIHESSNWIAQYTMLIASLSFVCLVLGSILAVSTVYMYFTSGCYSLLKKEKISIGVSAGLIIFACVCVAICMNVGPRYSGSGIYEIDKLHTKESGKQIAIVNDSKSDVELKLTNPDKNDYSKGDKIRVNIESNNSKAKGTHNLSRLMSLDRKGIFQTTYDTEKVSSDDSDIDKLLQALKDIDNDKDK